MPTTVIRKHSREGVIGALSRSEAMLRDYGITAVYVPEGDGPEGPIELAMDYDPTYPFTLLTLVELEHRLGDMLGRRVEITTLDGLEPDRHLIDLEKAERIF